MVDVIDDVFHMLFSNKCSASRYIECRHLQDSKGVAFRCAACLISIILCRNASLSSGWATAAEHKTLSLPPLVYTGLFPVVTPRRFAPRGRHTGGRKLRFLVSDHWSICRASSAGIADADRMRTHQPPTSYQNNGSNNMILSFAGAISADCLCCHGSAAAGRRQSASAAARLRVPAVIRGVYSSSDAAILPC